jgi:hypothetical protein
MTLIPDPRKKSKVNYYLEKTLSTPCLSAHYASATTNKANPGGI